MVESSALLQVFRVSAKSEHKLLSKRIDRKKKELIEVFDSKKRERDDSHNVKQGKEGKSNQERSLKRVIYNSIYIPPM